MIKQTYCSKDLCLKLEKKGIEASHVMQFEEGGGWYKKYTLDVVCKWLREMHKIDIEIHCDVGILGIKVYIPYISTYKPYVLTYSDNLFGMTEDDVKDRVVQRKRPLYFEDDKGIILAHKYFDSYDEAVSVAIEYCVDNI